MSGSFTEGVEDVGRSAWANIGDTYQAILRGETAPQATMTGTMEQTVTPGDEPTQSYSAALLQHGVAEGRDAEIDHWVNVEPEVYPGMPSPQEPDLG